VPFLFKFEFQKQKSAPTEVSAPKNANSNCRQTNSRKRQGKALASYLDGICIFAKFNKGKTRRKKSIVTPWGYTRLFHIEFVWLFYFSTKGKVCKHIC